MTKQRVAALGFLLVAALAAFVLFEWHVWSHAFEGSESAAERAGRGDSAARTSGSGEPVAVVGPAEAEEAPRARLGGRVLEADGRPIAEATVCAWYERTGPARTDVLPPACATTGKDGAYELIEVRATLGFTLGAAAAGHAPGTYASQSGEARLLLANGEQRAGLDLVLAGGGVALRGRVKDALGGLVAGAAISVSFDDERAPVPAVSNAKGEFVAWVSPGLAHVRATAPGYADALGSGYAPEHRFELSLLPGSVIEGRALTRPGGAPVAGAHIEAIAVDQRGRRSVTSQEDGTFRLEGLPPGRYRLEGVAPGLSGYSRAPLTVGLAETSREAVVELERSPPVTALVRDSRTKAPCESGEVSLHDKRVGEYAMGTIEPGGAVRFVAVLPGKYEVDVSCDGHTSKERYDEVTVSARPIEGLVWEVDSGTAVRGVVVDANGKPVANASVRADPAETETRPVHAQAHTDVLGAFVLRGLTEGKYTLAAEHQPAGADASQELKVDGRHSVAGVRLELGRASKLTGSVSDADGKPVAGVVVTVAGPVYNRAETRDDGSFVAMGLVPGNYRLSVQADAQRLRLVGPGGEPAGEFVNVVVSSAEEAKKALIVERRAGFLEGRVVDVRGEALPDFFIEASREGRNMKGRRYGPSASRVLTDQTGHFRVEGLADGEYTVRAYRQSGAQGMVEKVAVGARDVTIAIVTGSLTGTVVGPDGARPERFTLQVSGGRKGVSRSDSLFHANGAFALTDLPPGTYDVSIEAPEGTGSATATVTDKGTATVSVTLTAHPPEEPQP